MPQQTNARRWCIWNESRRRLKQNRRRARAAAAVVEVWPTPESVLSEQAEKRGAMRAPESDAYIGVFAQQFGVDRPDSAPRSTAFDRKRAQPPVWCTLQLITRTESGEWLPPSLYWPEAAVLIKRVRAEQLGDGDYLKWDRERERARADDRPRGRRRRWAEVKVSVLNGAW